MHEFLEYLSKTRCIHLTSFGNYDQFDFFITCIKKVKTKKRNMIISIDPGFEYTQKYWHAMLESLSFVDYMFLNEIEFVNLCSHTGSNQQKLIDSLKSTAPSLMLIIKKQAETICLDVGNSIVGSYKHDVIDDNEIVCDTGAGDAFAGGFLAGLLRGMSLDKSAALGSIAAKRVLCRTPAIIS